MTSVFRNSVFVLLLLVGGCANPYSKYYFSSLPKDQDEMLNKIEMNNAQQEPELRHIQPSQARAIAAQNEEDGYFMLGYSAFNSAKEPSDSELIEQAKSVGAYLVLYGGRYTHTKTSIVAMKTIGYRGYVMGVSYLPYDIDRYNYMATYWAKRMPGGLGIYVNNPTTEQQAKNGTNKGVIIRSVVKNGPSFAADLLPGDVIVAVNGETVENRRGLKNILNKSGGDQVKLDILRNGAAIVKYVQMEK